MSQSKRLVHLDVIKGLAIFFVILHHGLDTPIIPEFIDSYHMPLFILVSGILSARELSFSWEKAKAYWKKKVLQLLLPLLTIFPLSIYLSNLGTGSIFSQYISAFSGRYKGGYWFIFALFILLAIQYCTRFIADRLRKGGLNWQHIELTIMALPIPILLGLRYVIPGDINELMSFTQVSWLYPYLVLGFALGRYQRLDKCIRNEILSSALIVIYLIGFSRFVCKYNIMSLSMYPWSLCILIFTYSLIHRFANSATSVTSRRIIACLSELGKNSLGIYLVHYFFLPHLTKIMTLGDGNTTIQHLASLANTSLWAEIIAAVFVGGTTCSISYVVVRIIKQNSILSRLLLGEV